MRTRARNATLWIAAISAVVGTGLVLIFLYSTEKPSYLLDGMEFTAVASILALVLNIVLILMDREQQLQPVPSKTDALAGQPMEKKNDETTAIKRRQVLDERLQIDEPRLCSKNRVCTCWSFCGGDSVPLTVQYTSQGIALPSDAVPTSIPTVDRSKVTNCPFF